MIQESTHLFEYKTEILKNVWLQREGMVDDEKHIIVSARCPLGSFSRCGELFYKGGLKLALSVIEKVLDGLEGLSFEKEGVCVPNVCSTY